MISGLPRSARGLDGELADRTLVRVGGAGVGPRQLGQPHQHVAPVGVAEGERGLAGFVAAPLGDRISPSPRGSPRGRGGVDRRPPAAPRPLHLELLPGDRPGQAEDEADAALGIEVAGLVADRRPGGGRIAVGEGGEAELGFSTPSPGGGSSSCMAWMVTGPGCGDPSGPMVAGTEPSVPPGWVTTSGPCGCGRGRSRRRRGMPKATAPTPTAAAAASADDRQPRARPRTGRRARCRRRPIRGGHASGSTPVCGDGGGGAGAGWRRHAHRPPSPATPVRPPRRRRSILGPAGQEAGTASATATAGPRAGTAGSGDGSRCSRAMAMAPSVVPVKGRLAREALVQHEAQRVEVGPAVEREAEHLLRREVLRRAHHHVLGREVVVAALHGLGDAEVRQLHASLGGDENVARASRRGGRGRPGGRGRGRRPPPVRSRASRRRPGARTRPAGCAANARVPAP